MDKWEYKLIRFHFRGAEAERTAERPPAQPETPEDAGAPSLGNTSATLNELGSQGWEVVSAIADGYVLLLKRKKR